MYQNMVALAKYLYGEQWEINLRRLIRDVLHSTVAPDKLSPDEMQRICDELIKI